MTNEIDISKCPALYNYNVFGVEDKPCCYKYFDYCDKIEKCIFKQLLEENSKLKQMKVSKQ